MSDFFELQIKFETQRKKFGIQRLIINELRHPNRSLGCWDVFDQNVYFSFFWNSHYFKIHL